MASPKSYAHFCLKVRELGKLWLANYSKEAWQWTRMYRNVITQLYWHNSVKTFSLFQPHLQTSHLSVRHWTHPSEAPKEESHTSCEWENPAASVSRWKTDHSPASLCRLDTVQKKACGPKTQNQRGSYEVEKNKGRKEGRSTAFLHLQFAAAWFCCQEVPCTQQRFSNSYIFA